MIAAVIDNVAVLEGGHVVRLRLKPRTVYRKEQRKLSSLHRHKAHESLDHHVREWRFRLSSNALRRATS